MDISAWCHFSHYALNFQNVDFVQNVAGCGVIFSYLVPVVLVQFALNFF
jgi:hypothetical protein